MIYTCDTGLRKLQLNSALKEVGEWPDNGRYGRLGVGLGANNEYIWGVGLGAKYRKKGL